MYAPPVYTHYREGQREYVCVCGERLNQAELDCYTTEHLYHGAPMYCGPCRTCVTCMLPTLTDDDLYHGFDVCQNCPEPEDR